MTDIVRDLGRELSRVLDAEQEADSEIVQLKATSARYAVLDARLNLLRERKNGLEAALEQMEPTSLEGAMAQIIVASSWIGGVRASQGAEGWLDNASRLLYRAVAFLEARSGVAREEFGSEAMMPREHDPKADTEAA